MGDKMSLKLRRAIPALTRATLPCFPVFIAALVVGGFVFADDAAAAPPQGGREEVQGGVSRGVSPGGGQFIMKTADLAKLARRRTAEIVSEQSRQSFPIPVIRKGELHVLFLYYPGLVEVYAPRYLLSLQANSMFDELRAVTSKDFEQSHRADELIGTYESPPGLTLEQYLAKLDRLNQVYDVLMPEFGAARSEVSPEVMSAAKEFTELFDLLGEAPLKPYYDFLGGDFFAWIDQVSEHRSQGRDPRRGPRPEEPRVSGDSLPRTRPAAMGLRSIEDDIGIAEEKNHVVEKITEEPSSGRHGISFRHLAAIYWVRRDSPRSTDWLALLKRSQSEKRPVNFHHVVGWAQITYVELAQP